jgi:hypothetical protein
MANNDIDINSNGLSTSTGTDFIIGANWNGNNISTLLSWLSMASYNIECLERSIHYCRNIIRGNIILGLILSTASGTISIAQFGPIGKTNSLILNILFTCMTFIIAINTGRIKIYQIQERLEQFIKVKQEWISFVTIIATELQLPVKLRQDALYLISNYKAKYLELLKSDCEIPDIIRNEMEKKVAQDMAKNYKYNQVHYNIHGSLISNRGIKMSDIIFDIAYFEGLNLIEIENEMGTSYDASNDYNGKKHNVYAKCNDVVKDIVKYEYSNRQLSFFERLYLWFCFCCKRQINVDDDKTEDKEDKDEKKDGKKEEKKEEKKEDEKKEDKNKENVKITVLPVVDKKEKDKDKKKKEDEKKGDENV